MTRHLRTLLASSACFFAFALSADAWALDSVQLEIGAKVGYATSPSAIGLPNNPNPLGFGFGGRAGLAFKQGLYLGGSIMDYPSGNGGGLQFVQTGNPNSPTQVVNSVSTHLLMYGADFGYGIKLLDLLVIRPQVGFGDATLYPNGESSSTFWYLEPGVTVLVDLGLLFVGADANMVMFPNTNYSQAAFTFDAQVGVKF